MDYTFALQELARGQDLIQLLRTLPAASPPSSAWPEPAEALFEQVGQSLDMVLSILKSEDIEESGVYGSSPPPLPLPPPSPPPCRQGEGDVSLKRNNMGDQKGGRCKVPIKKSKCINSWATITNQPDDDGYLWRKYGEKFIRGAKSRRSYYRCSYKNEKGCQATKQVERNVDDTHSMFLVSYKNKHTCQDTTSSTVSIASESLPHSWQEFFTSDSHSVSNLQQENYSLLPFSSEHSTEVKQESKSSDNLSPPAPAPLEEQLSSEQEHHDQQGLQFSADSFDMWDPYMFYPMSPDYYMNLDQFVDIY